jgi:hypothetical protein
VRLCGGVRLQGLHRPNFGVDVCQMLFLLFQRGRVEKEERETLPAAGTGDLEGFWNKTFLTKIASNLVFDIKQHNKNNKYYDTRNKRIIIKITNNFDFEQNSLNDHNKQS